MHFRVLVGFAVSLFGVVSYGQGNLLEQHQANARLVEQRVLLREIFSLLNHSDGSETRQLVDNRLWELSSRGPIADIPLFLEFLTLYQHPALRGELVQLYHQEVPQRFAAHHNGEFEGHLHYPEPMEPDLESRGGVMTRIMNPFLVRHLQQRFIGHRWIEAMGERMQELVRGPVSQESLALIAMFLHQLRHVKLSPELLAYFTVNLWNFTPTLWGGPNPATRRGLPEMVERIRTEAQILIREQATAEYYEKYFRAELDRTIVAGRSNPRAAATALDGFRLVIAAVKADGSVAESIPALVSYLSAETSRYLASDSRLWIEALITFVESVKSEDVQTRFDLALVKLLSKDGVKLPQEIVIRVLVRLSRRPLQPDAGDALVTFLDVERTRKDSIGVDQRGWNGRSEEIRERSREYLMRLAASGQLTEATWKQLRAELASKDINVLSSVVRVVSRAPFAQIVLAESDLIPLLTVGTPENTHVEVKVSDRMVASNVRREVELMLSGPRVQGRLVIPKPRELTPEPVAVAETAKACYPVVVRPILGLR